MSLVHLTSVGQRPNSYFCQFPQGIQLGAGAEVCLVGYSGNLLDDGPSAEAYDIVIQEGQNDTLVFMHGDIRTASVPANSIYPPQRVKLTAGVYNPSALAFHIAAVLNQAERIGNYANNWTCVYDAVGPPTFGFLIKCATKRQIAPVGGEYINYNGSTVGVANGGASSTLTPHPSGISFIDTTPVVIGASGQVVGTTASAPVGCYMEFTTIAATTHEDVQYSLAMVPPQMASRMEFINKEAEYPEAPTAVGAPVTQYKGDGNALLDFAYGQEGPESVAFAPHAICVGPDGRIGIKECVTQELSGAMKDPANCTVRWTATNINLAAPGLKKIGMSFRQAAGAAGTSPLIVCEYLAWVAAAWVVIGSTTISGSVGEHATFRYAQSYFTGVVVAKETAARATSLPITIYRSLNGVTGGGAAADPPEPLVIAWMPQDQVVAQNPAMIVGSGFMEASRDANKLGDTIGFPEPAAGTTTPTSIGIRSTISIGDGENNGEFSPLLITCKDLPIVGYAGGQAGNTTALLGIGRVRGKDLSFGFSENVPENWLQLRNTQPITIFKLGIDVLTETLTEYVGLDANFSCWLKFRCDTDYVQAKENTMVGVMNSGY